MDKIVEVARRGQITIPKNLRENLGIEEGQKYRLRVLPGRPHPDSAVRAGYRRIVADSQCAHQQRGGAGRDARGTAPNARGTWNLNCPGDTGLASGPGAFWT